MKFFKTCMCSCVGIAMVAGVSIPASIAKTVKVTMTAVETNVVIDNKGTSYPAWTYDGVIPGKLVRITEGDTIDFTLINARGNKDVTFD